MSSLMKKNKGKENLKYMEMTLGMVSKFGV